MNKILFRILALCLAISLCFCGCSSSEKVVIEPMKPEKPDVFSFDFIGGNDVMVIAGFLGPRPESWSMNGNTKPNTITDKTFSALAECGINYLTYNEWQMVGDATSEKYADDFFKLAEKYGIAVSLMALNDKYSSLKLADENLKPFKKYDNFVSVHVTDEPSGLDYFVSSEREIAVVAEPYFKILNQLGYFGYCNLFPIYDYSQKEAYDDYLERFITLCSPKTLMYDHYVFEKRNYSTYFYNMSAIRTAAERHNIPWWQFIGAYTDSGYDNINENEYRWNINTALAYGAKGIQYYPAIQNDLDFQANEGDQNLALSTTRIGLIGAFGTKTRFWYYTKPVNEQIKAVDHVLMNSVNKGILANGELAKGYFDKVAHLLKGNSWRELKDFDGETMIGCFNYNGKSAFYVVNNSFEYAQKINLEFHDTYKLSVIQRAEESFFETDKLLLDMKAGEGVLVVIE
ncbi:MAG: hypothetical protein PUF48_03245 [Oscillospiraceae bacterium]|nr:hypothetical protein [Oscillospiraceae bacterium]